MAKTIAEINEKIKNRQAVVVTAEEIIGMVEKDGIEETARRVDVVTTGTFSPMCSSGAFVNFGHSDPPIRMTRVTMNDVPAFAGLAAVDAYIGATELSESKGLAYGGAHVIEDLIRGKQVVMKATSYGTDCYPRLELDTVLTKDDLNQAYLFNPRNAYQNYNAAVNTSDKTINTYMGTLLPKCGNVTYCTSGELSPLMKDPTLRTIGIGTRIFFGGTQGYVAWEGTQFVMKHETLPNGETQYSGATLALIGDLKEMNADYIRAASFTRYGTTLYVGMGIPIPVLDEELLKQLAVSNENLYTDVVDYSVARRSKPALKKVSYKELRSGSIELNGRRVPTSSITSLKKSREIAAILKEWIEKGDFLLTEPVQRFDPNRVFHPIAMNPVEHA